jgi:anti-anti-sigma factor
MEITKKQSDDHVEMTVNGRLDGYWSDHLARTLEETVRGGIHRIRLDLAAVDYISSLGLGVLVRFHKELRAIGGNLKVFNPSEPVREVMTSTGLAAILLSRGEGQPGGPDLGLSRTWQLERPPRGIEHDREQAVWELFEQAADAVLECRTFGEPALLRGCRFREEACRTVVIPKTSMALGLGALGRQFADCHERLGEFLAVGGAAAYLPTDGTNVPDYLMFEGDTPPSALACYGLICGGTLGRLARFEAKQAARPVNLSDIVLAAFEWAGSSSVGMVVATESIGLIGAALRRSPALEAAKDAPFAHPEIRDWITFTAERAFPHCVALIVGVASRDPCPALEPYVRPFGRDNTLLGHFHAAAFSYRSLPKGPIDLTDTVATLFQTGRLQGVLHLLSDYRNQTGLGESAFLRGACWFASIERIVNEK